MWHLKGAILFGAIIDGNCVWLIVYVCTFTKKKYKKVRWIRVVTFKRMSYLIMSHVVCFVLVLHA